MITNRAKIEPVEVEPEKIVFTSHARIRLRQRLRDLWYRDRMRGERMLEYFRVRVSAAMGGEGDLFLRVDGTVLVRDSESEYVVAPEDGKYAVITAMRTVGRMSEAKRKRELKKLRRKNRRDWESQRGWREGRYRERSA